LFALLAILAIVVSAIAAAWVNSHAGPDPDVDTVGILVLFAFAI
jgi:hypothetical protein